MSTHLPNEILEEPGEKTQERSSARVLPWRAADSAYSEVFERVVESLRPRLAAAARETAEAHGLLAELLRQEPERQEALVRGGGRFLSFALCQLLLELSRRKVNPRPRQGERLALLALDLVDRLDPAWYGSWTLADTRARCWGLVAVSRLRRLLPVARQSSSCRRRRERRRLRGARPQDVARKL